MAWKDFGSSLVITRRRRIVASALVYGLSLTVRFTSAAGEEVEAPAPSALGASSMSSVMINDGAHVLSKTWPGFVQPVASHGPSLRGCRAACEGAMPTPFMPACAAQP